MRWLYKTVHYELKKEGLLGSAFFDESEIEESLNEYGKTGWELVSTMEIRDGILAIFKQPFVVAKSAQTPLHKERTVDLQPQIADIDAHERSILVDDDVDEQEGGEIGVIRIE